MQETCRLAAYNAAATALAYQEHGFTVKIVFIDGLPSVRIPDTACELTHSLARITGTIAEALAMQLADAESHGPHHSFSEYFSVASYATMQAPSSRHGLSRKAIISKIRARTSAQHSAIRALADQIMGSKPAQPKVTQ